MARQVAPWGPPGPSSLTGAKNSRTGGPHPRVLSQGCALEESGLPRRRQGLGEPALEKSRFPSAAMHRALCGARSEMLRPWVFTTARGALSLLGRLRRAELVKVTARRRPTWRRALRLRPRRLFKALPAWPSPREPRASERQQPHTGQWHLGGLLSWAPVAVRGCRVHQVSSLAQRAGGEGHAWT